MVRTTVSRRAPKRETNGWSTARSGTIFSWNLLAPTALLIRARRVSQMHCSGLESCSATCSLENMPTAALQRKLSANKLICVRGGYGEREDEEFATQPFSTGHTGLLTETRIGGRANFLQAARERTSGLLFTIDTLYDAATFGLAALDFFTTTGARLNELLQLRLSPDCLYAMKVGGTPRLLVRLVPKGRDQPADYVIGPETKNNLERVGSMLKEHYQLGP